MVTSFRFLATIAAAVGAAILGESAAIVSPAPSPLEGLTVKNACVLANFQTATTDFIVLDNLVEMIKTTPTIIEQYTGEPLRIVNYTLATFNISFLGHTFDVTPTIDQLNVAGITTIAPMPVNVTSSNTLNLGTSFTGTIALDANLTVKVAQLDHKWYQICWVSPLHPIKCEPRDLKMAVTLVVRKPKLIAHVRANLYECAPGIPTSVCTNLTMTSIMTDAMTGNFTGVTTALYKNFKDVGINTLALGWDMITNVTVVFYNTSEFVKEVSNSMLNFSADRLNVKGYYHRVFLDVAQTVLLSLMNKIIDTTIEPLFGASCL